MLELCYMYRSKHDFLNVTRTFLDLHEMREYIHHTSNSVPAYLDTLKPSGRFRDEVTSHEEKNG